MNIPASSEAVTRRPDVQSVGHPGVRTPYFIAYLGLGYRRSGPSADQRTFQLSRVIEIQSSIITLLWGENHGKIRGSPMRETSTSIQIRTEYCHHRTEMDSLANHPSGFWRQNILPVTTIPCPING